MKIPFLSSAVRLQSYPDVESYLKTVVEEDYFFCVISNFGIYHFYYLQFYLLTIN